MSDLDAFWASIPPYPDLPTVPPLIRFLDLLFDRGVAIDAECLNCERSGDFASIVCHARDEHEMDFPASLG